MSMEIYENIMHRLSVYSDVEISEQQIESGQIKNARTALAGKRIKYGHGLLTTNPTGTETSVFQV